MSGTTPGRARKRCPITGTAMRAVLRQRILNRREVDYYYCSDCGLLQTESPDWLEEAYSDAISSLDVGLVWRNLHNRDRVIPVLHRLFPDGGSFIDLGGGYGLFTRLMRDAGFDFLSWDPRCENNLARGFGARKGSRADALCAFEVLEHLEDPLAFLREHFQAASTRTLLFSTELFDGDSAPPPDWWYYTPETGQHITFYQQRTLEVLAVKLDCSFHRLGFDLFLFTDRRLGYLDRLLLSQSAIGRFYARRAQRHRGLRSLLESDYQAALVRARSSVESSEL